MAEWLHEAGIGERRAALVVDGGIVAARIERDGDGPRLGAIVSARLVETLRPRAFGRVLLAGGAEAMLRPLPPKLTEGGSLLVEIVREPVPERGRPKRALAAPAQPGAVATPGPSLRDQLAATGHPVRELLAHQPDALEAAGWSELLGEAMTGEIAFPGGALRMTPTPAMTLFDVDGEGEPLTLALAGARAAAAAIGRHHIGGSIGIDLPTLASKSARQAVDAALDAALDGAYDRTATNGFGFVQIVRQRLRASLPELLAADPVAAAALALVRQVERTPPPGDPVVAAPRAVVARLAAEPGWTAELARRTGRATRFEAIR